MEAVGIQKLGFMFWHTRSLFTCQTSLLRFQMQDVPVSWLRPRNWSGWSLIERGQKRVCAGGRVALVHAHNAAMMHASFFRSAMIVRPVKSVFFAVTCFALVSCQNVKNWVPEISMPKLPKLPDMSGVKQMLPGSDDSVSNEDPMIPFDVRRPLAVGHTLRLEIYEGARNGKKVFSGLAMVNESGVIELGKIGSAKVGGRTLSEAVPMIESVCRIAGKAALQTYVHVVSVENVELISVLGDVSNRVHVPVWSDMSYSALVGHVGGRRAGSQGRAVYVCRRGLKKFYRDLEYLDYSDKPEAGDIVTLSGDL
jgi:hypothetical protein